MTETKPMDKLTDEILTELDRAMDMFPLWPDDPIHALGVVGEEYGETLKEAIQLTYEPFKCKPGALRKEAVQLAAMSLRFLLSMDRYHFCESEQHSQKP